ncbi:MAG: nitrate reductase [Gammaproteobacteria bacterium]|nr:nitrate reductase [Gammaproteobacteria bacterium]
MTLLDFARGPAMNFALSLFILGVLWRLIGTALLNLRHLYSLPRKSRSASILQGLITAGSRSWPHKEFIGRTGYGELLGYSYHIGLFIIILAFAPHITFFKGLFGITWPAMPSTWIHIISVLTFTLMIAVIVRRLTHNVLRRLSNFDDYFSWFITCLVVVTGLMASGHMGGPYETLLALHLLSLEALLIWFPFGKLMHAFYIFPSRIANGYFLARKGAPS